MPCERKQLKILWGLANEMRVPAAEHSSLACAIVDEMFVELRKALAACDESPWRSMESAPQDQSILVFGRSRRAPFAYVARYRAYESGAVEWLDSAGMCRDTNQITHWMPLPAAPEEKP